MTDSPLPAADAPTAPAPAQIAAATTMGTVRLTVSDLARSADFYERMLGLTPRELPDGDLGFGVAGGPPLVALHGDPSAPALDRRATGLFHLAILLPSRVDLAHALARLAQQRWPLDGASDHLVSEALYLSDPDGNGIELYRDRPREQWRRTGDELQMATLPLDLRDLAGELAAQPEVSPSAPAGTTMGHVHLQVSDLGEAEAFYHGILGFDVTTRSYPGALFVSAGGYHHHLGLNTWNSAAGAPAAPGAIGLRSYEVLVPDRDELDRVRGRIDAAGLTAEPAGRDAVAVRDPSGNLVVLRTA